MADELTSEERNLLGESCRDGLEHKCLRMLEDTAALFYCPTWLKKAIRDYFQT